MRGARFRKRALHCKARWRDKLAATRRASPVRAFGVQRTRLKAAATGGGLAVSDASR
jgi:hypothetical protein